MLIWQIEPLRLELKYTWKISRNASDFKQNFLITVSQKGWKGIGEVAPNIRYNETPEIIASEFERFRKAQPEHIHDLHDLATLLDELQLPNALRFGIESAYIHFLCHADQTDIHTFLGVKKPLDIPTSYSLPIMEVGAIERFYLENNLQRFKRLKVKVNAENGSALLKEITRISTQPLIVDGNEAWKDPDDVLRFMQLLKPYPVELIEQPLPAAMKAEYTCLKPLSPYLLMADESICANADFDELSQQFHGINMKLMKAGGYLNGLRLLEEAVKHHMHTMVGCMIETTLGISSALHLCAGVEFADLDGFLIIRNEPFDLVKEKDGMLAQ
jgi:L-alanine-DL-glutamate epimerase-like enolase superfamily enzyme